MAAIQLRICSGQTRRLMHAGTQQHDRSGGCLEIVRLPCLSRKHMDMGLTSMHTTCFAVDSVILVGCRAVLSLKHVSMQNLVLVIYSVDYMPSMLQSAPTEAYTQHAQHGNAWGRISEGMKIARVNRKELLTAADCSS